MGSWCQGWTCPRGNGWRASIGLNSAGCYRCRGLQAHTAPTMMTAAASERTTGTGHITELAGFGDPWSGHLQTSEEAFVLRDRRSLPTLCPAGNPTNPTTDAICAGTRRLQRSGGECRPDQWSDPIAPLPSLGDVKVGIVGLVGWMGIDRGDVSHSPPRRCNPPLLFYLFSRFS